LDERNATGAGVNVIFGVEWRMGTRADFMLVIGMRLLKGGWQECCFLKAEPPGQ